MPPRTYHTPIQSSSFTMDKKLVRVSDGHDHIIDAVAAAAPATVAYARFFFASIKIWGGRLYARALLLQPSLKSSMLHPWKSSW